MAPPVGLRNFSRPYLSLVALRFLLCFYQTGYIHPDEFLQSVEPVAGSFLGVNATLPWEFSSRLPVRSWSCLLLTAGLPALLAPRQHQLVASRLWMTLLSLLVDACVAACARLLGRPPRPCLELLASSYVMLVYATRTFSNSLELALSSVLMYLVLRDITGSYRAAAAERRLLARFRTLPGGGDYTVHRLRAAEAKQEVRSAAVRDSYAVGSLLCLGVFVRPTFPAFTGAPLLYWLFRGAGDSSEDPVRPRFTRLLASAGLTALTLTLTDSLMYGWLSWDQLFALNVSWENIVLTPFNFIVYNIKSQNLHEHGRHWCFTHTLVNIPVLFSSLGLVALVSLLFNVKSFLRHLLNLDVHMSTGTAFLTCSLTVPLLLLSCFPHQEARFLLPLLPPLVLLFTEQLQLAPGRWLRTRTLLRVVWYGWNAAAVVSFGFVHQGGVTAALTHLRAHLPAHGGVNVVFSHTYMPPQSLLLAPRDRDLALYDTAGKHVAHVAALIGDVTTWQRDTYVALPAPVHDELVPLLSSALQTHTVRRFWPHLSTEAPPGLKQVIHRCRNHAVHTGMLCAAKHTFSQLSLVLIKVQRKYRPNT